MYQPENEYSVADIRPFPDTKYFQYVIDQVRDAGVVVPLINNDVYPAGTNRPGSGEGAVDIYVHHTDLSSTLDNLLICVYTGP
jgi:beta-galactosidase